jgi:(2Fe-2S) ferredoxin
MEKVYQMQKPERPRVLPQQGGVEAMMRFMDEHIEGGSVVERLLI